MKSAEDWMLEFGKTQTVDLVIEGSIYSAGDTVTILSAHDIRKIQRDALTQAAELCKNCSYHSAEQAKGQKDCVDAITAFRDSLNKGDK